jgi:hypothetical protein
MQLNPIVELIRLEEHERHGTLGILRVNKRVYCATLEPPDKLNASNISSIPAQQYTCRPWSTPRYPETWEVCNVPGRSAILFHAGNTEEDTAGCILLGRNHAVLSVDNRGVVNSGNTFQRFLVDMREHSQFHLTIKEVY